MERRSMSSRETSRVMGMGKRAPSARRRLSTTLGRYEHPPVCQMKRINAPLVVRLVHEALQRGEATVHDQLEIA